MNLPDHHALLFAPLEPAHMRTQAEACAKALSVPLSGDQDVFILEQPTFSIDEARQVHDMAYRRPLARSEKYFFLLLGSINTDAQQALLKVFEEPPADTRFFIFVPTADILLPTVRSRMQPVTPSALATSEDTVSGFINGTPGERQKIVDPIIKSKDRQQAAAFVSALERELAGEVGTLDTHKRALLDEVLFVQRYSRDTSASIKLLLEHLVSV